MSLSHKPLLYCITYLMYKFLMEFFIMMEYKFTARVFPYQLQPLYDWIINPVDISLDSFILSMYLTLKKKDDKNQINTYKIQPESIQCVFPDHLISGNYNYFSAFIILWDFWVRKYY